jgi:hypothetical protein
LIFIKRAFCPKSMRFSIEVIRSPCVAAKI